MPTPIHATRGRVTDHSPGPAPVRHADLRAVTEPGSTPDVRSEPEAMRSALDDAARRLHRAAGKAPETEGLLRTVVALAEEIFSVPVAAGAIVAGPDGAVCPHAPTRPAVAEIDRWQGESGEGPGVDALHGDGTGTVHAPDLAADPRWPAFADRALARGFRSALSIPLAEGRSAAALNLYGDAAHRFGEHDRLLATLFADQARIALAGARRADALSRALDSRDTIACAKGILMERFGLETEAAFAMLVEASQNANIKLRDVAGWLVHETAPDTDTAPSAAGPGGAA